MNTVLRLQQRLVPLAGTLLLIAIAFFDPSWSLHLVVLGVLALITGFLRAYQLPLTKYTALNLLGMVAVGGSLLAGASTAAFALAGGTFLSDWLALRKSIGISWINAGREAVALVAAYGVYAAIAVWSGATLRSGSLSETLPAIAAFFLAHFVFSRGLLYFSLIVRAKLCPKSGR